MLRRTLLLMAAAATLGIALSYAFTADGFLPAAPAVVFDSAPLAADEPIQSITPEQALRRLQAGNARFADEMLEKPDLSAKRRQESATGQHPFAIVVTCADSRTTPEFIFDQGIGDLFVLRVAGNIADTLVLGSIEYAVEHLHAPLIVLMGHEKCGAVAAALGKDKPGGNLGALIREVAVGTDLPAERQAALAAAVKYNTRHQARVLTQRSTVIKELVEQKKVRIVAAVYGLASGKVEWFDDGKVD